MVSCSQNLMTATNRKKMMKRIRANSFLTSLKRITSIATTHAKPKYITTTRMTPETCERAGSQPSAKPSTNAENANGITIGAARVFMNLRIERLKTAKKKAKETKETKMVTMRTNKPLICWLIHNGRAKLKHRIPNDTGSKSCLITFLTLAFLCLRIDNNVAIRAETTTNEACHTFPSITFASR